MFSTEAKSTGLITNSERPQKWQKFKFKQIFVHSDDVLIPQHVRDAPTKGDSIVMNLSIYKHDKKITALFTWFPLNRVAI